MEKKMCFEQSHYDEWRKKNHNAEIYNAQIDHNKLVVLDASTPAKLHK